MRAYPLIYSRTKNVDFVPDFLARPIDINCNLALKFVGDAMKGLDGLNKIRHVIFEVEDFCICGVSCLSRYLYAESQKEGMSNTTDEVYLSDCKGRNTAVFVGIAFKRSDIAPGKIPDITYGNYWAIYVDYISKQWDNSDTKSELISTPDIEIGESSIETTENLEQETIGSKTVIKDYENSKQKTIRIIYDWIFNKNYRISFISDIRRIDDWNSMNFTSASVPAELIPSLKRPTVQTSPVNQKEKSDSYNKRATTYSSIGTGSKTSSFSEYKNQTRNNLDSKYANRAHISNTPKTPQESSFGAQETGAKKKSGFASMFSSRLGGSGFNNNQDVWKDLTNSASIDTGISEMEIELIDIMERNNTDHFSIRTHSPKGIEILENISDIFKTNNSRLTILINNDKISIKYNQ